ncbi:related to Cytochrome c oxidase subunit 6B-like protein new16 [Rhynchosporium agropyri]|uniref:Related to Cytochrome c oxidase subunit 6B-like protein new16 n=3 Tax=Rhynchosporium TaxID=38037 RepID=A0A1E1MWQ1_RHYSE|nr:related to Cytochrome c oxidase subunit 6B-like protein new16 [Rhynchosporium agropyri]CZT10717.1 related to Cytochrome c oxidase subunit 6B-like protein YMR244C-A [Rhynchosporium commune]CZT53477.1 related to Cytochrome c oxidase subunit 6B-like protein new16 [Rhynchosporium secalis]
MGLFSSSAPALPPPKLTTDGAPIAPDRTQRARCWEHRDAYFQCLDKNNVIDSLGADKSKAESACGKESNGFEANCASSWVTYFKKRRVMEWQREKTLSKLREEGAVKMPGELAPPRAPGN